MERRSDLKYFAKVVFFFTCSAHLLKPTAAKECRKDSQLAMIPLADSSSQQLYNHTCEGRCGDPCEDPFSWTCFCSCDKFCLVYGDCCEGFAETCPKTADKGRKLISNTFGGDKPRSSCTEERLVVSSCPTSWKNIAVQEKCLYGINNVSTISSVSTIDDLEVITPVKAKTSGVLYRNKFCAKCNDDSKINRKLSALFFQCPDGVKVDQVGFEELMTKAVTLGCDIALSSHGRKCLPSVSTCSRNCNSEKAKLKCETSYAPITCSNVVYKNRYCAYCNSAVPNVRSLGPENSCSLVTVDKSLIGVASRFSFSLLFSFKDDNSLSYTFGVPEEDYNINSTCVDGVCLIYNCPEGYRRGVSECLPKDLYSETSYFIEIDVVAPVMSSHIYETFKQFFDASISDKGDFQPLFGFQVSGNENCTNVYDPTNHNSVLNSGPVQIVYSVFVKADTLQPKERIPKDDQSILLADVEGYMLQNSLAESIVVEGIYIVTSAYNATTSFCAFPPPHRLDKCSPTVIPWSRWTIKDKQSIWVKSDDNADVSLHESQFHFQGASVIVCSEDLKATELTALEQGLSIFSIIILGLSLLCVLIRISLQGFISSFHNIMGKMQFASSLLLLLFLSSFAAGIGIWETKSLGEAHLPLQILAMVTHFGLICVFSSHTALSIHTHQAICKPMKYRAKPQRVKYVNYLLFTFIFPFALSAIGLCLQLLDVPESWNPHFGARGPWMYKNNPLIVLVLAPAGMMVITNIVLFIHIAITVKKSVDIRQKMKTDKQSQESERAFFLCLKLGLSMGILWIVVLLDIFFNHPVLEITTAIVFGGQGVFMFVVTCCTLPARRNIVQCCRRDSALDSSDSRSKDRTRSTGISSESHGSRR